MKRLLFVPLVITLCYSFFLLSFPQQILAATINLTTQTAQLATIDSEYIVNVDISGTSDDTDYYLRGIFYRQGTTNYCGLTWNGNDWFSGPYSTNEGWKNFYKITTTAKLWSGTLKAKIDTGDSGCKESGIYGFKLQRFSKSATPLSDTQEELSVTVTIPTPTPTLTPAPTSLPTHSPTPTPKPTSTPKPTLTPTLTNNTPTPTLKPVNYASSKTKLGNLTTSEVEPTAVLGASTKVEATPVEVKPTVKPIESVKTLGAAQNPIQKIFLGGMGVLALVTLGLGFYIYKQSRNQL
ncbi:hypothetical protein BH11PAT1_BH11PAT1_5370 [soil metagenome]